MEKWMHWSNWCLIKHQLIAAGSSHPRALLVEEAQIVMLFQHLIQGSSVQIKQTKPPPLLHTPPYCAKTP